jgi:LmbE family N-acetylglucosaminyl deacetylase
VDGLGPGTLARLRGSCRLGAVLPLQLPRPADGPLSVVAIGAHPDDIEIGAGGLLLGLSALRPLVHYVLLTGTPDRQREARAAVSSFLPGADVVVSLLQFPEGRLPAVWAEVKDALEAVARSCSPHLVLAPSAADAHQDHRTIGELVPTVFRDQLCLAYEIPKWDGDFGRPGVYYPLTEDTARRKAELLHKCYPSQHGRDWWDDEVFFGLARLRGMECRARYAEAFYSTKSVLTLGPAEPGQRQS